MKQQLLFSYLLFFGVFFSFTIGLPERCIDVLSTARGQHGPTIKQVSCSSAEVPLPHPAAALALLQTLQLLPLPLYSKDPTA